MQKTNEPFGTPDADGWYEWKGDDMVRPAGRVEVVFRASSHDAWRGNAEALNWSVDDRSGDIMKWRPAQ